MSETLTFQDIILKLLDYWKLQGCLVQQPYNVQVGAGTMNPASVLRVLGPEPWNVVYVEPSIRPDDGRLSLRHLRVQGPAVLLALSGLWRMGDLPAEADRRVRPGPLSRPGARVPGLGQACKS